MQPKSERIVILGSGSVATTVGLALYESGHEILEVVSRNKKHAEDLGRKVQAKRMLNDFKKVTEYASLYIIAVSDDAITDVIGQLPAVNGVVVHTSGTVSSDALKDKFEHWGVFYPLQTFTPGRILDFNKIPFLVTSDSIKTECFLTDLAASIGSAVYHLDDDARAHLHVAAVMINNFTNHLLVLAGDYIRQHHLPPHLFNSLVLETVKKSMDLGAENSQTGPAKRGDTQTIEKHLELIQSSDNATLLSLYEIFTKSIMEKYQDIAGKS